jgi:hypothetical protein
MPPVGFEATISAGEDVRLRLHGHWDRQYNIIFRKNRATVIKEG